jgi:predicted small metal-binding protein
MKILITPEKINDIAQELEMGMLCYYHIATGELESVPDEMKGHAGFEEEMWEDVLQKVKKNREQYICFEAPDSKDSFRIMEQYAAGITEQATRNQLFDALGGRKPFANFKFALQQYPDLLQQWYSFKQEHYMEFVQRQLDALNFNPDD